MKLRLTVALIAVVTSTAHLAVFSTSASGVGEESDTASTLQERVKTARDLADALLLGASGIVGTGIGADSESDPSILVLIESPVDRSQIPSSIGGVKLESLVVGGLSALPCPLGPTSDCSDPVPAGVSVGHPAVTAGTLGAYATDGLGHFYALSNNHIFAAQNEADIGDVVLQPGPSDGGSTSEPSHILGTLSAFEPIRFCAEFFGCDYSASNLMDAALAAVDTATVDSRNHCGWEPSTTALASTSLVPNETTVKKCGRTTGATSGTVIATGATVDVQMGTAQARFKDQVITDLVSSGGDSGSLITTTSNEPVALLFAGSETVAVGSPMAPILDHFGVSLVGDGPVLPPANVAPTATFSATCEHLVCMFDASGSSDSDGTISSFGWTFGDGKSGVGRTTQHAYDLSGEWEVRLTVTDDTGTSSSSVTTVAVSEEPRVGSSVGVFDIDSGVWTLAAGATTATDFVEFYFGNPGDYPIVGDWDCDGRDSPGLFRRSSGFAYLRNSSSQGVGHAHFFLGDPGDFPIAGDFDGDGCDTVSVYRVDEARFYILNELGEEGTGIGAAEYHVEFGNPGDTPVVGDWDDDGVDEIGLYRESTGYFYYRNSLTTGIADGRFYFGDPGDRFVAGDWGIVDGVDTPGVFRPQSDRVYLRHTLTEGPADQDLAIPGTTETSIPVAGEFGIE